MRKWLEQVIAQVMWLNAILPLHEPTETPWTAGRVIDLFADWTAPDGTQVHLSVFPAIEIVVVSVFAAGAVELAHEILPVDHLSLVWLDYPAEATRIKASLTHRIAETSLPGPSLN